MEPNRSSGNLLRAKPISVKVLFTSRARSHSSFKLGAEQRWVHAGDKRIIINSHSQVLYFCLNIWGGDVPIGHATHGMDGIELHLKLQEHFVRLHVAYPEMMTQVRLLPHRVDLSLFQQTCVDFLSIYLIEKKLVNYSNDDRMYYLTLSNEINISFVISVVNESNFCLLTGLTDPASDVFTFQVLMKRQWVKKMGDMGSSLEAYCRTRSIICRIWQIVGFKAKNISNYH